MGPPTDTFERLVMKLVGVIREVSREYQTEISFLEDIKG